MPDLGARLDGLVRKFLQPFFSRGRRGIEHALNEHAVVGDVAEQRGADVHLRHTRESILRELREIHHRQLAVELLQIRAREAAARRALATTPATSAGRSVALIGGGIGRWPTPEAAGQIFKNEPDGPRAGSDAVQLALFVQRLGFRLLLRGQQERRRGHTATHGFQKSASIQRGINSG